MNRLLLWDIDHTLLAISGVSREMYATAFRSVTGQRMRRVPDMAGKTDHDLVATVFRWHGVIATAELHRDFYLELAAAGHERRADMRRHGRVLPGAREALVALARVPSVVQSVVTGNIRPLADQKLSVFGLDEWIDLEVGGYGSDDAARSVLVRLARERAERKYATTFAADHVIVVGDTRHDIVGARANGAVAIGVASGRSGADELAEAGADVVLTSLVDTEALVRLVLGEAVAEPG